MCWSAGNWAQMDELASRLSELARTPILLIASDFDGTLSPLAAEPSLAKPNREAVAALHALAVMPQTHVAIISGRSLRDLALVSGFSDEVHLVGSHGSEFDPDFVRRLDPALVQLRDRVRDDLRAIARTANGFLVEEKPGSIAFHYRLADEQAAVGAVDMISRGPAADPRIHLKRGHRVIELSVVPTNKGEALASIRHRIGATAAIFIGDDESDEDAFATLCGPDAGIKVGDGATKAHFRVSDTCQAAHALATLVELREAWLKGSDAVDIEQHAMLSDQRTVALVTGAARVVWFCAPRIDSPAIFAELLGGPAAGFFAIRPADGSAPLRQSYIGNTCVLRTDWNDFTVTDCLDCAGGRPFQRAGRTDLVRMVEGRGKILVEFAPRLDFGREPTRLRCVEQGLKVDGSLDPIVLRAPGVEWTLIDDGSHQRAVAELDLSRGAVVLELRYGLSTSQEMVMPPAQRIEQTKRFWSLWADKLQLPPIATDLVLRSALILKALCYGPTGAIVAAATTSLPEHVGGVRNWDYRYAWLRDAAMAATALAGLGSTGTGVRLVDWLLAILDRDETPEYFRPAYTVTGEHLGVEAEIRELCGYRASRPVRVGNAAGQQLQLDVFGPIMDLLTVLTDSGVALSTEHWRLTEAVVKAVAHRWREPDHGIWEIRGPRRHHVHSKVMCWVAVDRALRVANAFTGGQPAEWVSLRDTIAGDVLEHGWDNEIGAFTAFYDDKSHDAATLFVGLSGLLPGDDPRFIGTVDAVERILRRGPTVYRYLYDDGLPGREGGFHLCTAWLIESLVLVGRHSDAGELFRQFEGLFGPTGLIPEEYCPRTKKSLGNHPQAYSHVGFINAALAVSRTQL